jgi:hypothetical protein
VWCLETEKRTDGDGDLVYCESSGGVDIGDVMKCVGDEIVVELKVVSSEFSKI